MYYSKSGQYSSGYKLGQATRDGTDCSYTPRNGATIEFGAEKDGSLTSDWEYSSSYGDLDECNGIEIDGLYSYLITDEFPYIPRCLMGVFSEEPGEAGPGGAPPKRIRAKFRLRNRSFVSRHDFDVKTKSSRCPVQRLFEVGS